MLKAAQILLVRLIRRMAEKSREVADRRDVSSAHVQAVNPRISMSSIMRWRNGLIALSVMGLLPVLRKRLRNHNLNTGQTRPVNTQAAPPIASNYRVAVSLCAQHVR